MITKGQKILLWTTPVAGAFFLLAYVMFPPFTATMSPTMTPEQVAAFFKENLAQIRGVVIFVNVIGATLLPLFAMIVVQMLRVVNSSPAFAYAYMISTGVGITCFILADFAWGVAAFRPDRDPQLISLLNDMAWIFFTAPVGCLIAQNICLAGAIYLDERPEPVFPRWVAHFNLVTALLFAPAALSLVNKTGPLAWDGSISFSLRLLTFAAYVAVMFFVLLKVIDQHVDDEGVVA